MSQRPSRAHRIRTFIPGLTPYRTDGSGSMSQKEQKKMRKEQRKTQKRRAKVPVVTIHGYKGSVLADGSGNIVWLTGAQAAGLSTPNLALPMKWVNGVQDYDNIRPKHTLKAVTVIPYLVGATLYEEWLKKSNELGCPAYEFSYDWRRSNCESVIKFAAYVRWISAKYNGVKVQVVAHSMGGLIAFAALNLYPELFHSVLFAGTPFRGGPGLLPDMHEGLVTGRNWDILSPRVISFYPSAHSILHLPGDHDDSTYTGCVDKDMKPIHIDWHNAEDWKKHKLGLFADETYEWTEESLDAFQNALTDARNFRSLVQFRPGVEYPQIIVLASNSYPTRKYTVKDGPKSVRGWDFESCPHHPGDGRVPVLHTYPPRNVPYEFVLSDHQHDVLLNDPRVPELLQKMVDAYEETEQSLYNPYHSRL